MSNSFWIIYEQQERTVECAYSSRTVALNTAREMARLNAGKTYKIAEVVHVIHTTIQLIEEELCPTAK